MASLAKALDSFRDPSSNQGTFTYNASDDQNPLYTRGRTLPRSSRSSRCQTEFEKRNQAAKGNEASRKRFHAFVLFLGELYLNLEYIIPHVLIHGINGRSFLPEVSARCPRTPLRPERARSVGNRFDPGANGGLRGLRNIQRGLRSIQRGLRSIQRGLRSIQRGLRNIQRGLRNIQRGLRNIQRGLRNIQRGLRNIQRGLRNIQRGLRNIQRGLRSIERGLRSIERGLRSIERGLRSIERGLRCIERGLRCIERGLRSIERGLRSIERGLRSIERGLRNIQCCVLRGLGSVLRGLCYTLRIHILEYPIRLESGYHLVCVCMYIKGSKGQVNRAEILQTGLKELLDALFSNPVDDNLICAVKLLKLTGSVLEDAWKEKGQYYMDEVIQRMKNVVLDSDRSRDVRQMLLKLVELRSSNWGRVHSTWTFKEATPENDPNYFMNEPTFYTSEGIPFTAADPEYQEKYQEMLDREDFFCEEPVTDLSASGDAFLDDLGDDEMDPEMQEAYEKFCLESEHKRAQ
ncbi:unnamed protein product [Ranitomeya imitator]|uniref:MIF4G domain-containing protein n=1 Tax=Ranitomeya imitator TaxID=111125 RepID=A0ABN9MGH4_9NEOB|nr:unnamed protein product [Ranitomeya imitator]